MKKIILNYSVVFFLFLSFSASAQDDLELFFPLPTSIEKITAIEHSIYKGDTISENFFEFNFDNRRNITKWEYFTYHMQEELKYDSVDRVIEIEGLYGESFANGNSKYYYPSATQKIEIHDKMGYYKYIKSDFVFDESNRVVVEIKSDSTSLKMTEGSSTVESKTTFLYDKNGNLIKELYYEGARKELIQEVDRMYEDQKLIHKNIQCYKQNLCTDGGIFFIYLNEGDFQDKKHKELSWTINHENDTIKSEVQYSYQKIDSMTISKEEKIVHNNQLIEHSKYFYKNNHLIRKEEYTIPKEDNQESKLSIWTEYSYFFYKKNKK